MDGSTCITPLTVLLLFRLPKRGLLLSIPRELIIYHAKFHLLPSPNSSIYNKQTESRDTRVYRFQSPITDIVELPYNQNTFNISFNVLDYTHQFTSRIFIYAGRTWRMHGTAPKEIIRSPSVTYRTAHYVFKVKTRFQQSGMGTRMQLQLTCA